MGTKAELRIPRALRDRARLQVEHLVRLCEIRGVTQREVAKACGISRSSIANIEKFRQPLRLEYLLGYADALGLPLAEVIADERRVSPLLEIHRVLADVEEAAELLRQNLRGSVL